MIIKSSCMASTSSSNDASFSFLSTTSTKTTLFLLLIFLSLHFTMATQEHTLSTPLTSKKDGAMMKMMKLAASTRRRGVGSEKIHVHADNNNEVMKNGLKRSGKSIRIPKSSTTLQWQKRIFNDNEHEVPSGPNPISN
ncbi:hypothetical protein HN51_065702 [Arachis hypogaea]|nr:CLE12 protein [Arachis hypogaea]